jgi:hypothetical protein
MGIIFSYFHIFVYIHKRMMSAVIIGIIGVVVVLLIVATVLIIRGRAGPKCTSSGGTWNGTTRLCTPGSSTPASGPPIVVAGSPGTPIAVVAPSGTTIVTPPTGTTPATVTTTPVTLVCDRVVINSATSLWTSSDWAGNKKITTLQCGADTATSAKYGSLYNSGFISTYNTLNPGCTIAQNTSKTGSAMGVNLAQCGGTGISSHIFPNKSVPDPANAGTCNISNAQTALIANTQLPGYPATGTNAYFCGYQKNASDCASLQGLTDPNGNALGAGICTWTPASAPVATFPQQPVYYYPATQTRDYFGPPQISGQTGPSSFVSWAMASAFAANESCEYVVGVAKAYITSIEKLATPFPYVYVWSEVTDSPDATSNVWMTSFNFSSGNSMITYAIAWAPSVTTVTVGGKSAQMFVPVCLLNTTFPCATGNPLNPGVCGYCLKVNIAARGAMPHV